MSSYQFDAWEASQADLDAIEATEARGTFSPEETQDAVRQHEMEMDRLLDDPAYIAYLEAKFGWHEEMGVA